jgi:hypothetical protein
MGLNFQNHVFESPGMSNPDLWAQRTTFGRDRPLRRQLQFPVRPTGHWRWDAPMGPRMSDPIDDPPDSPEGEAGPQRTVFGGASLL